MNRRRLSIVIASAVVATSLQAGMVVAAQTINHERGQAENLISKQSNSVENLMGSISEYGAIIFGNATMQGGDSETSFAIGGNLSAPLGGGGCDLVTANSTQPRGGVVIGEPINVENRCGLLLGGILDPQGINVANEKNTQIGKLSVEAPYIITTGKEADPYSQLKTSELWNGTKIEYAKKKEVENKFNEFKNYTNKTLKNAEVTLQGISNNNWVTYNTSEVNGSGKDANVPITNANLSATQLVNKNGTTDIKNIDIPENIAVNKKGINNFIVIYSDASTININSSTFNIGNESIDDSTGLNNINNEASKVIYVFPNATNVNISKSGVIGSIIAPNATVNLSGGFINGQLIAQNFNKSNGGEIHSFYFKWKEFNKLFGTTNVTIENKAGKVLQNIKINNVIGTKITEPITSKKIKKDTEIEIGKKEKDVTVIKTSNIPGGETVVKITENGKIVSKIPATVAAGNNNVVVTVGGEKITVKVVDSQGKEIGKEETATGNPNAETGLKTPTIPAGYHLVKVTNGQGEKVNGVPSTFGNENQTIIYHVEKNPTDVTVTYKDGNKVIGTPEVKTGEPGTSTEINTPVAPKGYHIVNITDNNKVVTTLPKEFGNNNDNVVVNIAPDQGTAKITVIDSKTNKPLDNATVTIGGKTYKTSADGIVTVNNLNPGTINVTGSDANFGGGSTVVNIPSNGTGTGTIKLTPDMGSAKITVINSKTNKPLDNATVTINGKTYKTSADGTVTVNNLNPGTINATGSDANFGGGSTVVNVPSNGTGTGTIKLTPDMGSAKVTVINSKTNKPLDNATVTINGKTYKTSAEGTVTIDNLTPGTISATGSETHFSTGNTVINVPSNGMGAGTIKLTPDMGSIKITVVNKLTGKPLDKAIVSIEGKTYETGNDGTVIVNNLEPETINVTGSEANYSDGNTIVTIPVDGVGNGIIKLTPEAKPVVENGTTTVTVRTEAGKVVGTETITGKVGTAIKAPSIPEGATIVGITENGNKISEIPTKVTEGDNNVVVTIKTPKAKPVVKEGTTTVTVKTEAGKVVGTETITGKIGTAIKAPSIPKGAIIIGITENGNKISEVPTKVTEGDNNVVVTIKTPEAKPVVKEGTTTVIVKTETGKIVGTEKVSGPVGTVINSPSIPKDATIVGITENGNKISEVPTKVTEGDNNVVVTIKTPEAKPVVKEGTTTVIVKTETGKIVGTEKVSGSVGTVINSPSIPKDATIVGITENGNKISEIPTKVTEGDNNVVVTIKTPEAKPVVKEGTTTVIVKTETGKIVGTEKVSGSVGTVINSPSIPKDATIVGITENGNKISEIPTKVTEGDNNVVVTIKTPEVKPTVKPETKPEVKPETKPEVKPETKPDVKPVVNKPVVENNTITITVKNDKGNVIKTETVTGKVGKDIPNITLPNGARVIGIIDNGKVINKIPNELELGNHNIVVIVKEANNEVKNTVATNTNSNSNGTINKTANANKENNANIEGKANPKTGDNSSLPYMITIGAAGALLGLLKRKDKSLKKEKR